MKRLKKAAAIAVALLLATVAAPQMAALKTAAGGPTGTNGFVDVSTFLDHLATYLIWLAIPAASLGIIAGGGMMIAGNSDGPTWIARSAIGFGIVLLAKGIMA